MWVASLACQLCRGGEQPYTNRLLEDTTQRRTVDDTRIGRVRLVLEAGMTSPLKTELYYDLQPLLCILGSRIFQQGSVV